jgi:hypothetical protein
LNVTYFCYIVEQKWWISAEFLCDAKGRTNPVVSSGVLTANKCFELPNPGEILAVEKEVVDELIKGYIVYLCSVWSILEIYFVFFNTKKDIQYQAPARYEVSVLQWKRPIIVVSPNPASIERKPVESIKLTIPL